MSEAKPTAILHLFTSAESAADSVAQAVIAEQKADSLSDNTSITALTLTPDNAPEALGAIFAADNITTWPGTALKG